VDINGRPTVISTFCGTGGSSLGYKWAGFHELLAVDFDAHAVECFKANFPDIPVWHKSVTDISGKEL
jgi:Site-specific DNA methylase